MVAIFTEKVMAEEGGRTFEKRGGALSAGGSYPSPRRTGS